MSSLHLFNVEGSSSSSSNTSQVHVLHDAPSAIELDEMHIGRDAVYKGPSRPKSAITRASTYHEVDRAVPSAVDDVDSPSDPRTPNELELSRPPSPATSGTNTADAMQTWSSPSMNKWRILGACLFCLANGCNDSAPGALLPYIEEYYHIGYAVVSLVFVANAIGFILAAFFIHTLDSKFGRAKTLMFSDLVLLVSYIILVVTPPFPAVVVSFFITGFGMAVALSLDNVFIANLANAHVLLGFFHGSYGIGGIIGPIVATALVSHGAIWSRFYFIILVMRVISFFLNGWAYWNFEQDTAVNRNLTARQDLQFERVEPNKMQQLKEALKNPATLAGALFIFAYQGAEVSTSGWVISFLISYRGGDPSKVGYVTSGFWGGVTVGRFCISHLGARIGEKLFVYCLTAGAVAFQLLVWLVPNIATEAVAVALLGLILGPVYPSATVVFARLLPRSTQNTAIAFISSAGSSGGALAPFMTGIIASKAGTWVLHPVCIALFAVMGVMWFLLPKTQKRRE